MILRCAKNHNSTPTLVLLCYVVHLRSVVAIAGTNNVFSSGNVFPTFNSPATQPTPQAQQQGQHRRHWKRKRKRENRHGQRIVEIEYYHSAKLDKQRFWCRNLRKRETRYRELLAAIPSFKTADYDVYVDRLQCFLQSSGFLLSFTAQHSFRKWRFLTYGMKMKALRVLAKRLVPLRSAQVCVAFGDWSCQDGLRGNLHGPVKAFRKALERRATAVPMDEFRTSKLCSGCHERLHQARLLTKVKDEDTKEVKFVLKGNRNVLHCKNSHCKAHFWNRDVNAARNILEL
ncbi:uncharacterized protein KRP23_14410 [Phytophthora ramorum]|uniref:uncharacterized protein n=1 Tax=Phytophthora ramorum TaxID=164328 RepID=UPI0030A5120A|nr:hypothetical protein KRP23_14410 [Phytophthora ramorum]